MAIVVVPIMAVAGCTLGCLNLVSEFERKCGTQYLWQFHTIWKCKKWAENSKTAKRLCHKESEPQIIEIPAQQFTMIPQQLDVRSLTNENAVKEQTTKYLKHPFQVEEVEDLQIIKYPVPEVLKQTKATELITHF